MIWYHSNMLQVKFIQGKFFKPRLILYFLCLLALTIQNFNVDLIYFDL